MGEDESQDLQEVWVLVGARRGEIFWAFEASFKEGF